MCLEFLFSNSLILNTERWEAMVFSKVDIAKAVHSVLQCTGVCGLEDYCVYSDCMIGDSALWRLAELSCAAANGQSVGCS